MRKITSSNSVPLPLEKEEIRNFLIKEYESSISLRQSIEQSIFNVAQSYIAFLATYTGGVIVGYVKWISNDQYSYLYLVIFSFVLIMISYVASAFISNKSTALLRYRTQTNVTRALLLEPSRNNGVEDYLSHGNKYSVRSELPNETEYLEKASQARQDHPLNMLKILFGKYLNISEISHVITNFGKLLGSAGIGAAII